MCQARMTHFTCVWCNDRWSSARENIICREAKGPFEKGLFGGCGKISGVDKSVYDRLCPRCPPKGAREVTHR
ncbi:unnamed protein product [Fusarium graminearum]|uniref:Chromosome 3, complete genome n=2 Tax=Gibberella zeae TaxID=5518 RepID=A0A0E0SHD8_GIBZE|nr:hypothetical protein FG05_30227 [Fusarium graminearum]CAF3462069.1 unnamed protein product [Fusarium graminearum]CAF3580890.1 unnamed protein product [Fusarium graminearum]CAG1960115.1 unnamed protein product [Fusarium graminearum]CAG1963461.1 unnamed protein product [Fusarium graminearum]